MAKQKKPTAGLDSGRSSDTWMSPRKPQTGDGKTKRDIFDKVTVIFRKKDGRQTK